MNLAALAMLQDLKRSRGLFAKVKKGKLPVRSMKSPSRSPIRSRVLVRMNGLAGDVSPVSLIKEAEVACRFLKNANRSLSEKEWNAAVESYFKAAAVATNVVFTAKVHGVELPTAVVSDMNCVIADGTRGIQAVMKIVAAKKMLRHERTMHGHRKGGRK